MDDFARMDIKVKDKSTVTVLINDKPKRRRLRVGDPDFVPPDGGWGWFVVFGCGFSNVSIFSNGKWGCISNHYKDVYFEISHIN